MTEHSAMSYRLERDDGATEVTLHYSVARLHRASWDGPAHGGELLDLEVCDDEHQLVEVTDAELAEIEAYIYENRDYAY